MSYETFQKIRHEYRFIEADYLHTSLVYSRASALYFWINIIFFTIPITVVSLITIIVNNLPIQSSSNSTGLLTFSSHDQQRLAISVLPAIVVCLEALDKAMKFEKDATLFMSMSTKALSAYHSLRAVLSYMPNRFEGDESQYREAIEHVIREKGDIITEQAFETPLPFQILLNSFTVPHDDTSLKTFWKEVHRKSCSSLCCCYGVSPDYATSSRQASIAPIESGHVHEIS